MFTDITKRVAALERGAENFFSQDSDRRAHALLRYIEIREPKLDDDGVKGRTFECHAGYAPN